MLTQKIDHLVQIFLTKNVFMGKFSKDTADIANCNYFLHCNSFHFCAAYLRIKYHFDIYAFMTLISSQFE